MSSIPTALSERSWRIAHTTVTGPLGVRTGEGAEVVLVDGGGVAVAPCEAATAADTPWQAYAVAAPAEATGALLVQGDEVHVALGAPHVAVPVRVWPGIPLLEPLAGPDGTPGELARAAALSTAPTAPERLLDARTAASREGEEAERQALLMAGAGDDSGAFVRRLVATVHAATLALAALAGDGDEPSPS